MTREMPDPEPDLADAQQAAREILGCDCMITNPAFPPVGHKHCITAWNEAAKVISGRCFDPAQANPHRQECSTRKMAADACDCGTWAEAHAAHLGAENAKLREALAVIMDSSAWEAIDEWEPAMSPPEMAALAKLREALRG